MLSFSLSIPLAQAVFILSQHYDDLAWLDSPNSKDFSVVAFGSDSTKTFHTPNDQKAFQTFLQSFSTNFDSTHNDPFVLTPLWLGYWSYESYCLNPNTPLVAQSLKPYPLCVWRHYTTYIIQHENQTKLVSFAPDAQNVCNDVLTILKMGSQNAPQVQNKISVPQPNINQTEYLEGFKKIQNDLNDGTYFELNYTLEHSTQSDLSPEELLQLYFSLRTKVTAPMMSYFAWPEIQILSASPELFFKISSNGEIFTHPIKGTISRGENPTQDEIQKTTLLQSEKDRAELLMATDMLRSDLGRVCAVGSIQTPKLFDLETFSHYHHLVAKISGRLKNNVTLYDVFCALFPGGSITGAPKFQVMQSIQALEKRPRGLYTGAIGVISEAGWSEFSIPIRTLVQANKKLEFATGGGIVIDSIANEEYKECFVKTRGIMEALKSFLLVCLCLVFLQACEKNPVDESGDFATVSDENTVLIRDYTFFPESLVSSPGQIVTFSNLDDVPHDLRSESAENEFDDTDVFSTGIIVPDEFGFITIPEDASDGDVYLLYCDLLQDLMATPNFEITISTDE